MPIPESDIEKVKEDQWVKPEDALSKGFWGYTPDETADDADTAAVQGPLAEKANQPPSKAKPAGKETSK